MYTYAGGCLKVYAWGGRVRPYGSLSTSNLGRGMKSKEAGNKDDAGSGENMLYLIPFIKLACCGAWFSRISFGWMVFHGS